jgi:hypothetical protein
MKPAAIIYRHLPELSIQDDQRVKSSIRTGPSDLPVNPTVTKPKQAVPFDNQKSPERG